MASITLTHADVNGGSPVTVLAQTARVSGTRNLETTPNANTGSQVDVQVLSHENLVINLTNVMLTGGSGVLTWAQILAIYRSTANATMTINYGSGAGTNLVGFDGATTSIKVQLRSFDVPYDTGDSRNASVPRANLTFIETA